MSNDWYLSGVMIESASSVVTVTSGCIEPSMASVSHSGLVTAMDIPGKVSVMVRHQDRVAVYNASIPLGKVIDSMPESNNFVEDYVFSNLKGLGIPPSSVCDDATFLRRITLDVAACLPTANEAIDFAADSNPDKRSNAIDCFEVRITRTTLRTSGLPF